MEFRAMKKEPESVNETEKKPGSRKKSVRFSENIDDNEGKSEYKKATKGRETHLTATTNVNTAD